MRSFILTLPFLSNQKILCKLLKRHLGVEVQQHDIFENGKLCLDALSRHEYDLVLLDIEMPVLDGCETAMRIRHGMPSPSISSSSSCSDESSLPPAQDSVCPPSPAASVDNDCKSPAVLETNRHIPIVVVTCNALEHQRRHYLSLGVNDVVAKPLQSDILIDSVTTHLRASLAARYPKRCTPNVPEAVAPSAEAAVTIEAEMLDMTKGGGGSEDERKIAMKHGIKGEHHTRMSRILAQQMSVQQTITGD